MPIIVGQQTSYIKFNNLTGLNETIPYIKQFKVRKIKTNFIIQN